jgi:hypothetical protein
VTGIASTSGALPEQAVRPRLLAGLIVGWLLLTIALGLVYVQFPPSPDAAIFDYVGWMTTRGARPYADVAEQNFPGAMWLHAVSTALFGPHRWSHRAFDYVLTLLGAATLFGLLSRCRLRAAGLVAALLYQVMVVSGDYWISGQRDVTAALFLLASGLAVHVRRDGGGFAWILVFALLNCAAVLIRPTYALFAPLLFLAEFALVRRDPAVRRSVLRDAFASAALCVAVFGGLLLLAWRSGVLAPAIECTVTFNRELYSQNVSVGRLTEYFLGMVPAWKWYLGLGALGGWFWWRDRRDARVGILLATLCVTSLVSAYVQGKGFGYHLGGILPACAILVAYFVVRSVVEARNRRTLATVLVAVAACAVVIGGSGKKLWSQRRPEMEYLVGARSETRLLATYAADPVTFTVANAVEAAEFVRKTTTPDQTVLTWSRALHINYLSERASPLRFATVGALELARPPFSRAHAWAEETEAALSAHPPELVFVPAPVPGVEDGFWERRSPSEALLAVRRVVEAKYVRERSFGGMDVYRRKR